MDWRELLRRAWSETIPSDLQLDAAQSAAHLGWALSPRCQVGGC